MTYSTSPTASRTIPEGEDRNLMEFDWLSGSEESCAIPSVRTDLDVSVSGERQENLVHWAYVGSSTVRVSEDAIHLLERLYSFRDRLSVLWFLECYPSLLVTLVGAYYRLICFFPESSLYLELLSDPDDVGEHQLIVHISTDMEPEDALAILDRFDDAWWLSAATRAEGRVCVNLEFS